MKMMNKRRILIIFVIIIPLILCFFFVTFFYEKIRISDIDNFERKLDYVCSKIKSEYPQKEEYYDIDIRANNVFLIYRNEKMKLDLLTDKNNIEITESLNYIRNCNIENIYFDKKFQKMIIRYNPITFSSKYSFLVKKDNINYFDGYYVLDKKGNFYLIRFMI